MDISVIFEMFRGCNGYGVLVPAVCLVVYVLAVKFDNMKWKKGFRL
tara:strand:- start:2461 stop:2598 length:138 start_codon:yes stop_codon:yes gene_type:complete